MSSMLKISFVIFSIFALMFAGSTQAQEPIGGPYTTDNNTMLLLHFDGNYTNESTLTDDAIGHGSAQFFPTSVDLSLNQCLYLANDAQGDSSYATVANNPALDLTADWTIEGWIYVLTFGTGSTDWRWVPRLIIKPGDEVFWRPNYWIEMWGDFRFFSFGYHDATQSAWPQVNTPNNFMEPGQWYHLTFIRDTNEKVIINMIHDANRNLVFFGSAAYETFSTAPPIITTQDVHIGWAGSVNIASPSTDSWLDGFVDEIRVSNIVRDFAVPPVISDVDVLANQPTSATSYPVSARVFKIGAAGTITSVDINYTTDGGSSWSAIAMSAGANNEYSADIPAMPLGTIVEYYIQAEDNGGLISTSPADALTNANYYSFGVFEPGTMVLHLDFEEGPGNIPVDQSSYHNPVSDFGAPEHSTNAAAGNYSIYFEGDSSYLEITAPFLANPEFTLDFWFNMDSLLAFHRIVSLGTSTGSTNYMVFLMDDSTMTAESSIPGMPSGLRDLLKLDTKIVAGQWYRINYQLDANQAYLGLFDAGNSLIEEKEIAITGPANLLDGPFRIGLLYNHTLYYGGYIDDVKVWNYATVLGIEPVGEPGIPSKVELFQNFPNPFNPATEIQFQVNKSQKVNLTVFDMLGRKVKTLVDKDVSAGKYKVTWNGINEAGQRVASGIYFYRLQTQDFEQARKMLLMK